MAGRRDGGLSSEQIRRMEENRRLAQQRLSNKRALAVGSTSQALPPSSSSSLGYSATSTQRSQYGPPPAKRAAINPDPSTHQCVPQERKVIGPPPKSIPVTSEYSYLGSSGQSSAAATAGNGSLVRLMDSSAASSSYQCPSQVAGGSSSFAASTGRGQQGGTFYSSDRGAPGPSATMRGARAVSLSVPSTSSQKVISVILIMCNCSWVHLYLLVGREA